MEGEKVRYVLNADYLLYTSGVVHIKNSFFSFYGPDQKF